MKDNQSSHHLLHPLEIYHDHLHTINDIAFTQREIDVLSCLLHIGPRSRKHIANLLSIDVKTVNLHISNATNKLIGYSNIDRLMSTLQNSDQLNSLKSYYLALLTENLFKKIIQEEILPLMSGNSLKCRLVYWQRKPPFFETLKKDLLRIGLSITVENRNDLLSYKDIIDESQPNTYAIYFPTETLVENLSFQTIDQTDQASFNTAFFLSKKLSHYLPSRDIPHSNIINPANWQSYYHSFFAILKNLRGDLSLGNILDRFEKEAQVLDTSLISFHSQIQPVVLTDQEKQEASPIQGLTQITKRRKVRNILVGVFGMSIFFLWAMNQLDVKKFHQGDSTTHHDVESHLIRSDLIIPVKPTLLTRTNLLTRLGRLFDSKSQEIQTIAIAGIGGTGKTVLARQYARSLNSPVIWEINAESKDTLKSSFESLAYALARTEAEKKAYRSIQYIKDQMERENATIQWVKDHLKTTSNWLLIYDNVDSFSDILKVFPTDSEAWGRGCILVTTRDANIQNNQLVSNTLFIEELTQEEKLHLFVNIIKADPENSFSKDEKEKAQQFLKYIPSYPLDISIAAYYIKSTRISYDQYLTYMKDHGGPFEAMQKKVLNTASHYQRTRYQITTLSLKRLIEEQENSKELLLFISLLDSQNIPKSLLDAFQNSLAVDNFIYDLKKYSLISENSSSQSKPHYSVHRSIQANSLTYLSQTLNLDKDQTLIQKIVNTIESYMDKTIADDDDIVTMKHHCEVIYNQAALFSDKAKASLRCILGMIYCYLANFEQSKILLEQNLVSLDKCDKTNYPVLAKTFSYLGMVYRLLGNYEKSKELLEQSLIFYQKSSNESNVKRGWALGELGIAYKEIGDFKAAINLIEKSLVIYRDHYPENHSEIARTLVTLGTVYRENGNYRKAKELFAQSLTIYRNKFSSNHPRVAWVLSHLGAIEEETGNYEKAKIFLEESTQIYLNHYTEGNPYLAWSIANLGNVYTNLNNPKKAVTLLEKSLGQYSSFRHDPIEFARVLVRLAKANFNLGDLEKSKTDLERALLIYHKSARRISLDFAYALKIYAQIHLNKGDIASAEKYLQQSLKVYQKLGHSDQYMTLESLADLYVLKATQVYKKQHLSELKLCKAMVINSIQQANEIVKTIFSEDSPHLRRIQSKLTKYSQLIAHNTEIAMSFRDSR